MWFLFAFFLALSFRNMFVYFIQQIHVRFQFSEIMFWYTEISDITYWMHSVLKEWWVYLTYIDLIGEPAITVYIYTSFILECIPFQMNKNKNYKDTTFHAGQRNHHIWSEASSLPHSCCNMINNGANSHIQQHRQ